MAYTRLVTSMRLGQAGNKHEIGAQLCIPSMTHFQMVAMISFDWTPTCAIESSSLKFSWSSALLLILFLLYLNTCLVLVPLTVDIQPVWCSVIGRAQSLQTWPVHKAERKWKWGRGLCRVPRTQSSFITNTKESHWGQGACAWRQGGYMVKTCKGTEVGRCLMF